jgi:long-chain acyl-CoA synthetase
MMIRNSMNLYSWLQTHNRIRPEKIAIRYREKGLTYSELFNLTDSLGSALRTAGIKRDDHVTIMLPNIPEFVISYMAIIGIGAIVTPVNPSFTSHELKHILSDSDSRCLIIEQEHKDTYEAIHKECPQEVVITVGQDGDFSKWVSGGGKGLMEERELDDVAVMIYSSGLTGYSMGAMLTQGNLMHQSDLLRPCMDGDDTDTTLAIIPCFHAFSAVGNMLSMLRLGGTIHLMKKLDFKELRHILLEGGITTISAVPTLFYGLVHHPSVNDIEYSGMKTLVSGGSALSFEIYNAFKERFHAELRQGYGITEASPVCSVNRKHAPVKPTSIGLPVPEVEAKIVDDSGNALKPLETGELLFRGPNIMKGYYKHPLETSEIIQDGWLHTGDLGYMDEDGYLFITGYKKDMIITSGFNVYCREVTGVLNSMPGISDSAIIGEPDLMRGSIIRAFVVSNDPSITEDDVKKYSRKHLASYKAPRKVAFVSDIPRDEQGKVIPDSLKPIIEDER